MRSDREKWDLRYSQDSGRIPEADEFVISNSSLLTSGIAMDLACGLGGDSIFLAERGYTVHAVDISSEAIFRLARASRRMGLDIHPVIADLDRFPLPKDYYDLIVVFYFFAKDLMPGIVSALRKGGLLFYATYNQRHKSLNPCFNPDYLVPPDGLAKYFPGFDILIHETAAGERQNISRVLAEKAMD
ncbi:MAG: class I SAM-dependent methyltransferase [Desulfomonile tiedjei]|uniref:Class I SAM-dependent methyltransferase n=1 Tax=Desulfomonile tiedjei TaxID=2358 RepID=A0A9D6Z592_9BACT|nr:class I SAM-dependent methyltransferase [Desulfomonile tiedjei]